MPNSSYPFQFIVPPAKVPKKSIVYAVVLFLAGSILLILGSLFFTGILANDVCTQHKVAVLFQLFLVVQASDKWLSMLILGALMFIPGSYHTYIAYYSMKGEPGLTLLLGYFRNLMLL